MLYYLLHDYLSDLCLLVVFITLYLADDISLVADSCRCLLLSAVDRTRVVPCTHNTFSNKSFAGLEQSTVSLTTGSQLRTTQMTTEHISVRD